MLRKNNISVKEKSAREVQDDCRLWAKEISADFTPDLVVFVAKSGFLFAEPMSKVFRCNIVDIKASRPSNKEKDKAANFARLIPLFAVKRVLASPWMIRRNEREEERNVEVSSRLAFEARHPHKRILLVDDSVDTGRTLEQVFVKIRSLFPGAEIRVAGYAVLDQSLGRTTVDYCRIRNAIVLTATGRKSKEYPRFIRSYEHWAKAAAARINAGAA